MLVIAATHEVVPGLAGETVMSGLVPAEFISVAPSGIVVPPTIGAGVGLISVAPSGMLVLIAPPELLLEPSVPRGDVIPRPGAIIELWA
ncbi:MAG: hypothetical protein E6G96_09685 [Alphaproteobacteria bacterium]|nr:MAG: hypothetical protein E6G96_09685 [Alphaproteobacteria bacterium]